jgi:hypothetical protein
VSRRLPAPAPDPRRSRGAPASRRAACPSAPDAAGAGRPGLAGLRQFDAALPLRAVRGLAARRAGAERGGCGRRAGQLGRRGPDGAGGVFPSSARRGGPADCHGPREGQPRGPVSAPASGRPDRPRRAAAVVRPARGGASREGNGGPAPSGWPGRGRQRPRSARIGGPGRPRTAAPGLEVTPARGGDWGGVFEHEAGGDHADLDGPPGRHTLASAASGRSGWPREGVPGGGAAQPRYWTFQGLP